MDFDQSLKRDRVFAVKDGPPSETVLRALRTVREEPPTEMKPLYEVIDPDALDALFRGPNPGTVTFEYGEYTVVVREDAEVVIET